MQTSRALKEKQKADVAAAEMEALRNTASAAEQRVVEAQAATERVATELRDYKVCT